MFSYPSYRFSRFISADKITANPDFYHQWALRSARRLSTLVIHSEACYTTSYLFEQLAAIRGFAYAIQLMGAKK